MQEIEASLVHLNAQDDYLLLKGRRETLQQSLFYHQRSAVQRE